MSRVRGAAAARAATAAFVLFTAVSSAVAVDDEEVLHVAAVQFEVTEDLYLENGRFEERVDRFVARATDAGAELVVFPEYINVFLLFDELGEIIRAADTFEAASAALSGSPQQDPRAALRQVVAEQARDTERRILALWGETARRHGVAVIAGSYFAAAPDGTLRNRALVFDAEGRLMHMQDKAYLTPFERRVLGLEPGDWRVAEPFVVDGFEIGMTICRDSYFSEWESSFAGVDLWVDIRANGERYTQKVRERFAGALAERVASTSVGAGINASLTGHFLDLIWEGPAYAVDAAGRRTTESRQATGSGLIHVRVERSGR